MHMPAWLSPYTEVDVEQSANMETWRVGEVSPHCNEGRFRSGLVQYQLLSRIMSQPL